MGQLQRFPAAKPHLRPGTASLITVSASLVEVPRPMQAHACAAKTGIDQLVRVLGMEWGRDGVRVNGIAGTHRRDQGAGAAGLRAPRPASSRARSATATVACSSVTHPCRPSLADVPADLSGSTERPSRGNQRFSLLRRPGGSDARRMRRRPPAAWRPRHRRSAGDRRRASMSPAARAVAFPPRPAEARGVARRPPA